jgi:hypothetical protein
MPTTAKPKPFVASVDTDSTEWQIIEKLSNEFAKEVIDKQTGKPRETAKGIQTRRLSGKEVIEKVLLGVLVKASEQTLASLATDMGEDTLTGDRGKTGELFLSIPDCRTAGTTGGLDLSTLSDEALRAELDRRDKAKKPGAGTKNVSAI